MDGKKCPCRRKAAPLNILDYEFEEHQKEINMIDFQLGQLDREDNMESHDDTELCELQLELAENELKLAMLDRELNQLEIDDANDPVYKCDLGDDDDKVASKTKTEEMQLLEAEMAEDEDLIRQLNIELENLDAEDKCCGR